MGIVYSLIRVRPETVAALRDNPRGVAEFVYGDPGLYEAPSRGLLQRLFGKPEPDPRLVPARREEDEINLDKSWHIVHYLLTGSDNATDSPLNIIADESDRLADIDVGLPPPLRDPSRCSVELRGGSGRAVRRAIPLPFASVGNAA